MHLGFRVTMEEKALSLIQENLVPEVREISKLVVKARLGRKKIYIHIYSLVFKLIC